MDAAFARALAVQLETTAKALRQLADSQEAAQAMMADGIPLLSQECRTVLDLDIRSRKTLVQLGIKTVADLIQKTPDELLRVKNFGVTSLKLMREELRRHGLALKDDGDD